jgi:anti-sigma-K factor RskA
MPDTTNVAKGLRERFSGTSEERLGRALSDLLENPLFTGALGRASDAREKAAQAQEVAMGALNLPSAADIERLTRRLRSVSLRLEGIEDGVQRLDRAVAPDRVEARLAAIEEQLAALSSKLGQGSNPPTAQAPSPAARRSARSARASARAPEGSPRTGTPAAAKRQAGKAKRKRA